MKVPEGHFFVLGNNRDTLAIKGKLPKGALLKPKLRWLISLVVIVAFLFLGRTPDGKLIMAFDHGVETLKIQESSSAMPSGKLQEWRGIYGGLSQPGQLVVKDQRSWEDLWRKLFRDPAPTIDFDRYMVVAIFMGLQRTGGYAVTILSAEEREGKLVISYRETVPGPGDYVTQALTTPYHIK